MGLFIRTLILAGVLGRLGWYFVGAFLWVSPRGLRCTVGVRLEKGWKRKKISMQKRYITVTPDFRPTALNWALFSLDAHRRPLGETQRKALPKYQPDLLRTPANKHARFGCKVWVTQPCNVDPCIRTRISLESLEALPFSNAEKNG